MKWVCCLLFVHYLIATIYCRPEALSSTEAASSVQPSSDGPSTRSPVQPTMEPKTPQPNRTQRPNVIMELAQPTTTLSSSSSSSPSSRIPPTIASSFGDKITLSAGVPNIPNAPKRPHEIPASATLQSTLSTHLSVRKPEEDAVHKPTILDIITETEMNQTKQQTGRFAQQELLNQKANAGHPGVAEPLTWQQLEREMAADQKIRDSSTSKEGISTWILLSGSDQQQTSSSSPTPSATTIAAQVEKLEIQAPPVTEPAKRTNFRFQETHQAKLDKIGKIRQAIERRQGKPEKKNNKPTVTTTIGTTSTTTEPGESLQSSSVVTETKVVQRRKNPSFVQISKQNKKKPSTTTTSTTTSETPMEELTTIVSYIHGLGQNEEEATATTTGVPFLVLEPKDADFDLPQDRSPGTTKKPKRPNTTNKTKKKNVNKTNANGNKKNPNTKIAVNKQKEKPLTTKIYNYLSREVMPTVGVGLVGIVVTAGLASYFFGPLGALRRSYDDAIDRQDTGDSIYSVNSEEYASGSSDNGQNEEEVFGKFIAGMPANYMPKYVRYYQPQQGQAAQQQAASPQNPQGHHQYPGQRRVYGQQNPNAGPKYGQQQQQQQQQYFRNRNGAEGPFPKVSPSPHYNPVQYSQQQPILRNHQPQPQQPLASPYIQQLHDLQMQKSLSSNIETVLKQHTFVAEPTASYKANGQEKSTGSDIVAEEKPAETVVLPSTDNLAEAVSDSDDSNQIQRRISHFVVGSVVPENKPDSEAPAVVEPNAAVSSSPEIITATHGPRRRRSLRKRRQADAYENARYLQSRTAVETELQQIDELFKQLKEKIDRLNTNQTEPEKIVNEEKIRREMKRAEENVALLHQVIDHVKDIEKFQKEFYIKSKNWELAMTLKTGMNHIRKHIALVSDLIDHPNDENLIRRIDLKDSAPGTGVTSSTGAIDVSHPNGGGSTQIHISPLDDLLKIFQLKALFGLNILQNIRPSFERAFEEVFRMPAKEKPN